LPVEVWTRFMRAAHQGVPVVSLPNAQVAAFPTLAQIAAQITAPAAPPLPAPLPPPPVQAGAGYRPPPTRAASSAPTRPEAAAGLDGWLMDRLLGGR
jgi:penicillin-binding protein 1A